VSGSSAGAPALFVPNSFNLGPPHTAPHYIHVIGIDNHDFLTVLDWRITPTFATATGTLHDDDCQPSCAGGTYLTYPVQVTASNPRHCSVTFFEANHSGAERTEQAYVFNRVSIRALHGHPSAGLLAGWPSVCDHGASGPARLTTSSKPKQPTVILDGYGPLHIGMTLATAQAALGRPIHLTSSTYGDKPCGWAPMTGSPDGKVRLLFLSGRLVRIDVLTPKVRTLSGVGVGSSVGAVTSAYRGHITTQNDPLTSNSVWLIYRASDPVYATRELLFDAPGGTVAGYRVGYRDTVEAPEPCLP
jgi:hypothetical protein